MNIGEWIFNALLVLLGAVGALNLGMGCLFMVQEISKKLRPKWIYIYVIATALGIVALGILCECY